MQAWGPPVPQLPPPGAPTEASNTAAHRLDLHCRRALTATATALPDAAVKRAAGRLLNDCRRALLARCAARSGHAGFCTPTVYVFATPASACTGTLACKLDLHFLCTAAPGVAVAVLP